MAALARAFKIEEIENNPSLVEGATKDCFDCDEDNPKAVPRLTCKACGGSGHQELAIGEILKELKVSKNQKPGEESEHRESRGSTRSSCKKKIKAVPDDDLYLEY